MLLNSAGVWTIQRVTALKQPTRWSSGQDRSVLTDEGQPVVVEAFLVHAKTAEPESCNCYLTDAPNNDIHLNLTATASQTPNDSVVAEITPRVRPEGWTLAKLTNLYEQKAYVRVTGWLMFDSEHVDGNGGPRATLWEIHPVTKVEVCAGGNPDACSQQQSWQLLETYSVAHISAK